MRRHSALWILALAGLVLSACHDEAKVKAIEDAAAANSPFVGKPAPAFDLPNADGQHVSLASRKGKWFVLYFYPKDDTPGCTCQATEFTYLLKAFRDLGTEVYGISPDSPRSHRHFAKKFNLRLNLLSDPDHKVMKVYGAWADASGHGRVIRSTFLIDPQGVIRHHWPEVVPTGHAARVRAWLEQLQKADAAAAGP